MAAAQSQSQERTLRRVLLESGESAFSGRIDVDIAGYMPASIGTVYFAGGEVLDAKLGNAFGEPALWRMLLPERLTIAVEAGRPRSTSGKVLGKPAALLERFDERLAVLDVYAQKVGGFERVWAIRFDALAAVLEELPDAINPVLRLLDGKRTVRQVVSACPLDDMLALRILGKLLAQGILVLPDDVVQSLQAEHDHQHDAGGGVVDVDEGLEAALAASLAEMDAADAAAEAEAIPLTTRASTTPPAAAAPAAQPSLPPSVPPGPMPPPGSAPAPAVTPSNDTLVEYDIPRPVTMAPDDSATLPVLLGLPSAPPVETQADLRSWLGSEEAFFSQSHPPVTSSTRASGLSPLWMIAILVAGAALGALLTMKAC